MEVLLVIDMQKVSFKPETPRYDQEGVVKRINMLSNHFRKKGLPVIIVQHDGTNQGYCIKGSSDWECLETIEIHEEDIILSKIANDAFYKTGLDAMLRRMGVRTVVITGCATDFCVDATVKGALVKDFIIKVISDGHTTGNRPQISAKDTIDYFNWLWSENIPTKGKIEVLSTEDFMD